MAVYINSAAAISPQDTFWGSSSPGVDFRHLKFNALTDKTYFNAIHPDYKQYINPTALRRMSPIIRMGLATARVCLEKAGLEKPDAILVGSGLGCVRDTAKFLNQVLDNQEVLLNPTAFIQSTHNTVSGQIALLLDCHGHNLTFSQNTLSFENALLEGMMLMDEGRRYILLGGSDEIVEESYQLMEKNGCVHGPMGEGSSFFVLSTEGSDKSLARVEALEIQNRKMEPGELKNQTMDFLASRGLQSSDLDFLISGRNGDELNETVHSQVEQLFPDEKLLGYKHLVGEYHTASAFAMWLGAQIIAQNQVPAAARLHKAEQGAQNNSGRGATAPIRHVLLFNENGGRDFSWILLSHPDA